MNDNYYDLDKDRVYNIYIINSEYHKLINSKVIKTLDSFDLTPGLYSITEDGDIVHNIIGQLIPRYKRFGEIFVKLSYKDDTGQISLKEYRLVDLVADKFIRNNKFYRERAARIAFRDLNSSNCRYDNIYYN